MSPSLNRTRHYPACVFTHFGGDPDVTFEPLFGPVLDSLGPPAEEEVTTDTDYCKIGNDIIIGNAEDCKPEEFYIGEDVGYCATALDVVGDETSGGGAGAVMVEDPAFMHAFCTF